MIAKSSVARRYGHRLHSADVRDDVRWLLDGAVERHHRPLVDTGDEQTDGVTENGSLIRRPEST
jgi:hypothetical protein